MANCAICQPQRKENVVNNMHCVDAALQTLMRHFAEYKTMHFKQQCELDTMKEQNVKLRRIVQLFQKQTKITPSQVDDSYIENESTNTSIHSFNMITPSKLDTAALDCEDQLGTSPVNISPRSNVDVIAETEMLTHNSRVKRLARQKTYPQFPLKDVNGKYELHGGKSGDNSVKQSFNPEEQTLNVERSHKKQISLSLRKKGLNWKQTKLNDQQEKDGLKKTQINSKKSALSWILSGSRDIEISHLEISVQKRDEQHDEDINETLLIPSPTTNHSVVLVSPKTPDIIILDESGNSLSTTNMNKTSSSKLNFTIQNQSKKKQIFPKTSNSSSMMPVGNKRIKSEKDISTDDMSILVQEVFEENANNFSHSESEDSFNVRPIVVKDEPQTPKCSINERFKLNCPDCEEFFATNTEKLNDEEIAIHLKNCKHYKHRHNLKQLQTPDGFWNPLIPIFDENDPRNEVLIDNRFEKHRRNVNLK